MGSVRRYFGANNFCPSSTPSFVDCLWPDNTFENDTLPQLASTSTGLSDMSDLEFDSPSDGDVLDSSVKPYDPSQSSWSPTCPDDMIAHLGAHSGSQLASDQTRLLLSPNLSRLSAQLSDQMLSCSRSCIGSNASSLFGSGLDITCGPVSGLMSSHSPSFPTGFIGFTDRLAAPPLIPDLKLQRPAKTWSSVPESFQLPSPPPWKPAAKAKTSEYPCGFPGCRRKPFHRYADLVRHFKHVHQADDLKTKFFCDYVSCPRNRTWPGGDSLAAVQMLCGPSSDSSTISRADNKGRPFGRQDHYREHLREHHGEDLLKRPRRHGTTSSSSECAEWWENRHIDLAWWRCSKCLRRIKVKKSRYMCDSCATPCDPERIKFRESKKASANLLTPSSSSPATTTTTSYDLGQEAQEPEASDPLPSPSFFSVGGDTIFDVENFLGLTE